MRNRPASAPPAADWSLSLLRTRPIGRVTSVCSRSKLNTSSHAHPCSFMLFENICMGTYR